MHENVKTSVKRFASEDANWDKSSSQVTPPYLTHILAKVSWKKLHLFVLTNEYTNDYNTTLGKCNSVSYTRTQSKYFRKEKY